MTKKIAFANTLALAATLLLSGITVPAAMAEPASAATATFGDYQTKDFLSDYSKLVPVEGDQTAYRYLDNSVDFSKYFLKTSMVKIVAAELSPELNELMTAPVRAANMMPRR